MTRTDKRLARLEAEIEALKPSLAERLDNLEAASEGRDNTPKSRIGKLFAWIGDEGPKLIVAVVLLVMGYWIKDSVDLAIKRQQLQLDSTKQMQSQLEIMADEKSTKEQIERAAMLISAYGQVAIIPMLNEMGQKSALRPIAAERGLGFIALSDPEDLCRLLPRVLANRTAQFGWETHLRVIRILGQSGCKSARSELEHYRENVLRTRSNAPDATYNELVSDHPTEGLTHSTIAARAAGMSAMYTQVARIFDRPIPLYPYRIAFE